MSVTEQLTKWRMAKNKIRILLEQMNITTIFKTIFYEKSLKIQEQSIYLNLIILGDFIAILVKKHRK